MGVIALIILGGAAGFISSTTIDTNSSQNKVGDILLGILGAMVSGITLNFFGAGGVTWFNFYSLIVAIIGSVALIGLGRLVYR